MEARVAWLPRRSRGDTGEGSSVVTLVCCVTRKGAAAVRMQRRKWRQLEKSRGATAARAFIATSG